MRQNGNEYRHGSEESFVGSRLGTKELRLVLTVFGIGLAVTLPARVLQSQSAGVPRGSAPRATGESKRCGDATELAPVSAAKSIRVEELDAWNKRYLIRGDTIATNQQWQTSRVARSGWPEVDPRSTLIVHFGYSDRCAPPFKVRLRGLVRKQSGTSRSLEIPRYFQAGVAQAEPQSRTFAWKSAKRILTGVPAELAIALQASRTTLLPDAARARGAQAAAARDTLEKIRDAAIALERTRIAQIDSSARFTVRAQTDPKDSASDSSAAVLQRSIALLTSRLDSARDAQAQLLRQLDSDDRKQQVAASRDELRELLAIPQTQLAIRLLRQPTYAPALRELAAQVEAEHVTLDSLLARLDRALVIGANVIQKKDQPQSEADVVAGIRDATTQLRKAEAELLQLVTLAAAKAFSPRETEDPLLLPDAEIPLRGSSVAEGEQVSLEISFIADDGAILESATYEFAVVKLGGAVRNIRDVALFLNRCSGGSSIRHPCRTASQSIEVTASELRKQALGSSATGLDLLRLDAIERSRDIPAQDRYVPVPGVVFEALFRPRVLESDGTKSRVFKKAIRTLGLSAGVSVSFVSYTDRRVTVNLPTVDQLKLYYDDPDPAGRAAKADTLFRLGASDLIRQDLSIAPAFHFGVFEGAVSWAFGANLRATSGRYFSAVGFSFLGLTEAGAKLIGSIKGN